MFFSGTPTTNDWRPVSCEPRACSMSMRGKSESQLPGSLRISDAVGLGVALVDGTELLLVDAVTVTVFCGGCDPPPPPVSELHAATLTSTAADDTTQVRRPLMATRQR